MPHISVVTICLNSASTICKTMESVLGQSCRDVEYVIQDGLSEDGTCELIGKYLSDERIDYRSEKDSGLYNAMNRAVKRCTGDYVLFLNSGDIFCDERVLEDMLPYLHEDIVFGNVIRLYEEGEKRETYRSANRVFPLLLMGRMPCHQVIFARREVLQRFAFREQFSITADYDFLVRCHRQGCSMLYVDRDVSRVDCVEGVSSQRENLNKMRSQDDESLKESYPFWYQVLKPVKYLVRRFL